MFLGFAKNSDACSFLNLGPNFIVEAWDIEFFEDEFMKDKDLSLKNIPENAEKFIALMNLSLQNLKVLMLKKKLQKL